MTTSSQMDTIGLAGSAARKPAPDLTIRRARIEDIGVMKKLCRELVAHLRCQGHDAPFLWESERLEDDMFGPHRCIDAFLAFHDGEAVGYIIFGTSYDIEAMRRELQALDLYVSPEMRGAGVADRLMERVAAYARHVGAGQISLYIYKRNPSMAKFCARFGFDLSDKHLTGKIPVDMVERRSLSGYVPPAGFAGTPDDLAGFAGAPDDFKVG